MPRTTRVSSTRRLTISFSADGTTLYASDDQGIWQFKTTADLADSTSGTLVGLNDLRTLGVPYDGQNSAVAVVDTGVDASRAFVPRPGRAGYRYLYRRPGQPGPRGDARPARPPAAPAAAAAAAAAAGGGGTVLANTLDGHGTPVAGVIAQFVPQATIDPVNIFLPYIGRRHVELELVHRRRHRRRRRQRRRRLRPASRGTANALTSTNLLYNGLEYVIQHPFVNDPLRPGKVDRVIAASFAFGTTQTFQSEVDAYKNYPQIVIALKNAYHKFLKEGIAPIAAAGEFGAPLGAGSASSSTGGSRRRSGSGTTGATSLTGANNADNSAVGDSNGMSLPAVLDEVISVTGVYSFPYDQTPASPPTDRVDGVLPNPLGPILLLGNSLTIGGTALEQHRRHAAAPAAAPARRPASTPMPSCSPRPISRSTPIGSWARPIAATRPTSRPRRSMSRLSDARSLETAISSSTTTGTGTTVTNPLTFTQAGTSMSEAIVTGAYALVSSALTYWTNLATSNGYTADAYLTTPVGVDSLNFGKTRLQEPGGLE